MVLTTTTTCDGEKAYKSETEISFRKKINLNCKSLPRLLQIILVKLCMCRDDILPTFYYTTIEISFISLQMALWTTKKNEKEITKREEKENEDRLAWNSFLWFWIINQCDNLFKNWPRKYHAFPVHSVFMQTHEHINQQKNWISMHRFE